MTRASTACESCRAGSPPRWTVFDWGDKAKELETIEAQTQDAGFWNDQAKAQELVEQGRKQIRFEQKQAIEALRKQVADLAIGAAERLVEKSLDEPRQRKLVEDYMRDLAASLPEERSR